MRTFATMASLARPAGVLALGLSFAACGAPPPPEVAPPAPPPDAIAVSAPRILQVAGPDPSAPPGDVVRVDARTARTPIGTLRPGERLELTVEGGSWTYFAGGPPLGASGEAGRPCTGAPAHRCLGGEGTLPMMGLVLLSIPRDPPGARCAAHVLGAGRGIEFRVPEDMDVALAPNDWEDALADNEGGIRVAVEVGTGPRVPAWGKREIQVDARAARTELGRFRAGDYLMVTILSGGWSSASGRPRVGAEGSPNEPCRSAGAHRCVAGEGAVASMALLLLTSTCPPKVEIPPRFVATGLDTVAERDVDLFLAPNDWEDGLWDNSGALLVRVAKGGRGAAAIRRETP